MSKIFDHDDAHGDTVASAVGIGNGGPREARSDKATSGKPALRTRSCDSALVEGDSAVVEVDPLPPSGDPTDRIIFQSDIGEGGMAFIRRVHDSNLKRDCALKQLNDANTGDEFALRRLIEEAQITAQLDHPNIVPVHELGVDDRGMVFFTMKFVRGKTLTHVLKQRGEGAPDQSRLFDHLQVYIKVCDTVSFAHNKGVIHRDLKPDNIMVGTFGQVYVMDWGIAKLCRTPRSSRPSTGDDLETANSGEGSSTLEDGVVIGTPGYMAPEQAVGDNEAVDERSDVFALGAILYEVLTGHTPHSGRTGHEILVNSLTSEIASPQSRVDCALPTQLCKIAMKALNRNPEDRYCQVADLKEDVERFLRSGWQFPSRSYSPGDVLVREGDVDREAFVITQGTCAVYKSTPQGEVEIRLMKPGDAFGEIALLTSNPRTATVRAVDEVSMIVITREKLEEEMGAGFFLGSFLKSLASRFHEKDGLATILESELDGTELATRILKYMIFAGEHVSSDRVEIKWSQLCDTFAESFGKSRETITSAIEKNKLFELDLEKNVLSLSRYS